MDPDKVFAALVRAGHLEMLSGTYWQRRLVRKMQHSLLISAVLSTFAYSYNFCVGFSFWQT